ncbi:MAG: hypothetical protein DPW16_11120 [Chloroflexi bacterium]|nr:hypothetical protein [Chloroflexota bacterium]
MNKTRALCQLTRYFGLRWIIFRLVYSLKLRSGWLRRSLSAFEWSDRPLSYWLRSDVPATPNAYIAWRRQYGGQFFFKTEFKDYAPFISNSTINMADKILAGYWLYFGNIFLDIGMPPNWHVNPLTKQTLPTDCHWTKIPDFNSGDIKYIWEANRFSVVYILVRAYAASQDSKYAIAFWQLVDDWAIQNPPQLGANWKCGQEATFRVMAWCFGLHAFFDHARPEQIMRLVTVIAAHGARIEGNIAYARSQNNNHGVSEGVGLWTIGVLFTELQCAKHWAMMGKQVVDEEIRKQVYEDGTYAQYSPNYQRVMLHGAIWALRLGELNDNRFSDDIYRKVEQSADFLFQLLDHGSGHVPNHGFNDSALILPLNDADINDFRPVIQTAHYLIHRQRIFAGFDEDIYWLFGPESIGSPILQDILQSRNLSAQIGGYYTLRGEDSWLMVRCASYQARPHHADQLHVDFWWRNINICSDAGTYLYNGGTHWQNGLRITSVHNTVSVDNISQMTPYNRFLWLDWSHGCVNYHDNNYWEGSQDGYIRLKRPVTHRRGILRHEDVWIIVDELTSNGPHTYRLHWLIPDMPYKIIHNQIALHTDAGPFYMYCSDSIELERAQESGVQGWRSQYYGQKEPALSLYVTKYQEHSTFFWTILTAKPVDIKQHYPAEILINDIPIRFGKNRLIEAEAL